MGVGAPQCPWVGARPGLFAGQVADGLGFSGDLPTAFWLKVGSDGIKGLGGKEGTGHPPTEVMGSPGKGHFGHPSALCFSSPEWLPVSCVIDHNKYYVRHYLYTRNKPADYFILILQVSSLRPTLPPVPTLPSSPAESLPLSLCSLLPILFLGGPQGSAPELFRPLESAVPHVAHGPTRSSLLPLALSFFSPSCVFPSLFVTLTLRSSRGRWRWRLGRRT